MRSLRLLKKIRLQGLLFFVCFILFLVFAAVLNSKNPSDHVLKAAYVFLVRNPKDLCYALANSQRVFSISNHTDIILIMAYKPKVDKRAPLPPRVTIMATPIVNEGYDKAFLRFEAFGLLEYDRVIVLNSNSVITVGLHSLLWEDLEQFDVAASLADHPRPHLNLSSSLIVARPSQELYERVAMYQNPNQVQRVADQAGLQENDGSTKLDMLYEDALLSGMFEGHVKLLPPYLKNLGIGSKDMERYREEMNAYCYIYLNAPAE